MKKQAEQDWDGEGQDLLLKREHNRASTETSGQEGI
jgi:hypothetical protein